MSAKQSKKVHYTSSTKGSSVVGDRTSSSSSAPKPAARRPSISTTHIQSHVRHPSDSGVGSSSTSSPIPHSSSFFGDAERDEQRRNIRALNEAVNTLKDRVQDLERENRRLNNDLLESNREKREMRRERDEMLRIIEELKGKVAKDKMKDGDGIRVRGGNLGNTTPEKPRERAPVMVERNTPPMTQREKERDSEARKREAPAPASPIYRNEGTIPNPMSPRYRDEEKRKSTSPISPTKERLPNPFTPLVNAQSTPRGRRASVSYGPATGGGYGSAPQGYPGLGPSTIRVAGSGVPYIRGEVEIRPHDRMRVEDDLFPNDGKYHPYPL